MICKCVSEPAKLAPTEGAADYYHGIRVHLMVSSI